MQKVCRQCAQQFEITPDDLVFYEKVSPTFNGKKYLIPPPTLCPDCRMQRRLAYRNERTLHRRKCDYSGKEILSTHHPSNPYPVYSNEYWWEDVWDAKNYARSFDFSKPFFEQFFELKSVVPAAARNCEESAMENSEYCNEAGFVKNSYLCFEVGQSEDCLFSRGIFRCVNCVDCLNCGDCTLCYECQECQNCYNSSHLMDCTTCSDSKFCSDCQECQNCFMCTNLRNKKYCFMNEQLNEATYKEKVSSAQKGKTSEQLRDEFLKFRKKQYARPYHQVNCENCRGDYLVNSKNCIECYSCAGSEDCKYCDGFLAAKNVDCMDISNYGYGIQYSYECQNIGGNPGSNFHTLFTDTCWPASDLIYCQYCVTDTQNCFGCIGLKKARYCILNKQYTKEEYESLVPKIIDHMVKTGEWGEFFPIEKSPFAYNETLASEYFPISKEEVMKKGLNWRELTNISSTNSIPAAQLPASINDVTDELLNRPIECEISKRPFKIIRQELDFYRRMNISIPHSHPDERHKKRMSLRNPRHLWSRTCSKCQTRIQTTYSPDRPEAIFCEQCYLETVY